MYKSAHVKGFKNEFPAPITGDAYLLHSDREPKYYMIRYYIPPVARSVSLAIFCTQGGNFGAVARLGAPPQCNLPSYTPAPIAGADFIKLPWENRGASLATLRKQDWRVQNVGGVIPLVGDNQPVIKAKGEWLYVRILGAGTSIPNIDKQSFGMAIDKDEYAKWYDGKAWNSDGDPAEIPTSVPMGDCDFGVAGAIPDPIKPPVNDNDQGNILDDLIDPKPDPQPDPDPDPDPDPVTPAGDEFAMGADFPLYDITATKTISIKLTAAEIGVINSAIIDVAIMVDGKPETLQGAMLGIK